VELSAQMEDYLEVIWGLCRMHGIARVKDISSRMKVTGPSVVGALRTLKTKNLVRQERYGFIRLTEEGERIAASVQDRHDVLAHFLEAILGLDPETAAADACRIEHAVSPETVRRLHAAAEFIRDEAHADLDWNKEFRAFYARYKRRSKR
jgi:DtxR family Mn-dependent transcriptional regulator